MEPANRARAAPGTLASMLKPPSAMFDHASAYCSLCKVCLRPNLHAVTVLTRKQYKRTRFVDGVEQCSACFQTPDRVE